MSKVITWEQVGEWIANNQIDAISHSEVKDAVLWFVATQQSDSIGDMGQREAAELYLDGIPPMSEAIVNDWLEMHYESFENCNETVDADVEEAETNLLQKLNSHFNTKSTSLG